MATIQRGVRVTVTCPCGVVFHPRKADVDRGWGKYHSKKCKAIVQEKRTGQNAAYQARQNDFNRGSVGFRGEVYFNHRAPNESRYEDDQSWDSHKDTF